MSESREASKESSVKETETVRDGDVEKTVSREESSSEDSSQNLGDPEE